MIGFERTSRSDHSADHVWEHIDGPGLGSEVRSDKTDSRSSVPGVMHGIGLEKLGS